MLLGPKRRRQDDALFKTILGVVLAAGWDRHGRRRRQFINGRVKAWQGFLRLRAASATGFFSFTIREVAPMGRTARIGSRSVRLLARDGEIAPTNCFDSSTSTILPTVLYTDVSGGERQLALIAARCARACTRW